MLVSGRGVHVFALEQRVELLHPAVPSPAESLDDVLGLTLTGGSPARARAPCAFVVPGVHTPARTLPPSPRARRDGRHTREGSNDGLKRRPGLEASGVIATRIDTPRGVTPPDAP